MCRLKLMPAHLVVLRPGLRWQTTGDEEEISALQFRTVPTEHLGLAKQDCACIRACVCVCECAGVHCLYFCRLVELFGPSGCIFT